MKATFTYDGNTYSNFNKLRFVQNAYGFDIVFTITNNADTVIDLTGKTVSLELKDIAGTTSKDISLSLSGTPTDGTATWSVVETDLDTYSVFDTEITVTETGVSAEKFNVGLLTVTQEIA